MPCHSISVGSAPPHSSWPSARPAMRQRYRPFGLARSAATAWPASRPCAASAASVASSRVLRATRCSSRGARAAAPACRLVQAEPARARWRRRIGVDGDDFQVGHREGRAGDGQQPVVRAHGHVLAAGRGRGAEHALAPLPRLAPACARADHQVVDRGGHSSTSPRMQALTSPPTQTVSPSLSMCTRPARCSAAPCAAT